MQSFALYFGRIMVRLLVNLEASPLGKDYRGIESPCPNRNGTKRLGNDKLQRV
jgi:hypothetical protein